MTSGVSSNHLQSSAREEENVEESITAEELVPNLEEFESSILEFLPAGLRKQVSFFLSIFLSFYLSLSTYFLLFGGVLSFHFPPKGF